MRWNARKTQGGVAVAAADRKGDVYLGTPKGQSLRSLKAAERWLGLAATTPADAASASATASSATAGAGGSTASAAAAAALAPYLTDVGAAEPEAEAEPGTVRDGLEALLHEVRRYLVITPPHTQARLHEVMVYCYLVTTPSLLNTRYASTRTGR